MFFILSRTSVYRSSWNGFDVFLMLRWFQDILGGLKRSLEKKSIKEALVDASEWEYPLA